MLSNASMVAETKAKGIFSRPFAVHVELIRVLKNISVSVCGLIGGDDALICTDELEGCQFLLSMQPVGHMTYLVANHNVLLGSAFDG